MFQIALADLDQLEGKAAAADFLLHKAVPIMAVVGWVVFGPRGLFTRRIVPYATLIPVAWVLFTLARGPFASDWYPYPFVDVVDLGYVRVLVNVAVITAFFFGLAAAATPEQAPPTRATRSRPVPGGNGSTSKKESR